MTTTWKRNRNYTGSTGNTEYVASNGYRVIGRDESLPAMRGGSIIVRRFQVYAPDGSKPTGSFGTLKAAKTWVGDA